MFDFLEKYIMGPMMKFSQLRFVRAITQAGMSTIAFTIVGSMFLVISVLPQAFPVLTGIWAASFDHITPLYMAAYNASMGIISVYFLIVTTYEYAKIIAEEDEVNINPVTAVGMGFFALFMLMCEYTFKDGTFALASDPKNGIFNGYASGSGGLADLAAIGIFTAFIVSWFVTKIYELCVKKNIVIKMPESVPEGVSRAFTALVPGGMIAVICMVVNGVLTVLGTNIYDLIAIPFGFVVNLTGTLPGLLVIYFLIHALWLVGIHGATIVTSPLTAITLANVATNVNGGCQVFAGEFNNAFVTIGGSGGTLGLCMFMCFLAKSDQLKYLGRSAMVPGLFNINEPLLFGIPIVYNPNLAIPFFLAPMAEVVIAFCAITFGIVPPVIVQMAWPTPIGIGGFLSTGGDIRGALLAVVCAAVSAAIYFPFFKAYDAKLLAEEKAAETEAE